MTETKQYFISKGTEAEYHKVCALSLILLPGLIELGDVVAHFLRAAL